MYIEVEFTVGQRLQDCEVLIKHLNGAMAIC